MAGVFGFFVRGTDYMKANIMVYCTLTFLNEKVPPIRLQQACCAPCWSILLAWQLLKPLMFLLRKLGLVPKEVPITYSLYVHA